MEEPKNSSDWFILHDGERFGPYTMEELKQGVESHEINPRLDMAWKEGMADWIIAGEVEGLFEKKTDVEGSEKKEKTEKKEHKDSKKSDTAFSEFEYGDDGPTGEGEEQGWEGVSRGGFFFFCFIFPIIWWVGLAYGFKMLDGVLAPDLVPFVIGCLALLPFFTGILAIIKRFQNLAMSRLWFFGLGVPFLQIWLCYRLFACPPGYAEHKKLGVLGWILAVIYWLPSLAMIGIFSLVMIQGLDKYQDKYKEEIEKNRGQYDELMLKVIQLTESPEERKAREEEEKAKEKAAKGPSIITIRR